MESFNHFPDLIAKQEKLLSKAVTKTCLDLEAAIKMRIRANGQIDTGFMVNSVYSRTYDSSTYSNVGQPTRKGAQAFDEVERPPNNKTGYVAIAASYAQWQNYGTHLLPARPFLEPSVDLIRPEFEAALAAIDKSLSGGISVE